MSYTGKGHVQKPSPDFHFTLLVTSVEQTLFQALSWAVSLDDRGSPGRPTRQGRTLVLVSQDEGQGSAGSRTHRCGHGARTALQPGLLLGACSQGPRDCRAPLRLRLGDGTPAAGATDHRPSWSPRGSPGRAEPARREAGASSQADKARSQHGRTPAPRCRGA